VLSGVPSLGYQCGYQSSGSETRNVRRTSILQCMAPNGPPVFPAAFSAQTLEDALIRYAGAFTEEQIRAGFAEHDLNDNGSCAASRSSRTASSRCKTSGTT
jgi:hypothetical protein